MQRQSCELGCIKLPMCKPVGKCKSGFGFAVHRNSDKKKQKERAVPTQTPLHLYPCFSLTRDEVISMLQSTESGSETHEQIYHMAKVPLHSVLIKIRHSSQFTGGFVCSPDPLNLGADRTCEEDNFATNMNNS